MNIFGYIATITSIIGLTPQVYKTYQIKSSKDISMLYLVNILICSISWMVHGFYVSDYFVIISNVTATIVAIISIAQKIYYDKKQQKL